ncbi:MAG: thioesterase superfamily protein, partial [Klenkia sp.]|nr:thioesterase superfamily protein [Klenkia sp.]
MTGDEELHRPSMTVLLTPDTSTVSGTVHGGQLLELLHQVASTCASRYGRNHAATPGGDQVVVTMRPRRGPQARRREVEQRAEEIRAAEPPPPGAALTAL